MNTLSQSDSHTARTRQPVLSIALVTICIGFFLVILDTTIVNVALPAIQREFGATVAGLQWIVEGYNLVFASFLLTAGALGDRIGSKRVFLSGLLLFAASSAICGVAPTLWMLQAARVLQGCGAALLVPNSLALLSHVFLDQRERARAIGIWGGVAGTGAIAGPVLGGFLVNALSWRSIFWVNIPIAILGFFLTLRYVPTPPRLRQRGLDLAAQIVTVITLAALTFVLIEGNSLGWRSLIILLALVIFVLALLTFLVIERSVSSPMLPLELFSKRTFSAANAVGILLNLGFYGQLFVISLYFQQVRGYSPLVTGLALLPETGMVMIASLLSGRVTGRIGPRVPMVLGLAIGCVGFFALVTVQTDTAYLVLCTMLIAIGFGTALTMPAMTAAVIASAPKNRSGIAAAVLNASRQVGSVLGVAILGSLVGLHRISIPGMHTAMLIAGGAFLFGSLLSLVLISSDHLNDSSRN